MGLSHPAKLHPEVKTTPSKSEMGKLKLQLFTLPPPTSYRDGVVAIVSDSPATRLQVRFNPRDNNNHKNNDNNFYGYCFADN